MIVAYLLLLLGTAGVIWSVQADLSLIGFIGGGLLVGAVRLAYEIGKSRRDE